MYIFRLFLVLILLSFDLSSNKDVILSPRTSTEVADIDPCLLGSWRVDIPSMSVALDRPVSGSILITFETSPVNEITAGFDVTITRRPPQSPTKRRVHSGTFSATMEMIDSDNDLHKFKLTGLELGEENSHKRYKADGDWVDIKESTEAFFRNTTFVYSDCSPSMLIGMYTIKLIKEP